MRNVNLLLFIFQNICLIVLLNINKSGVWIHERINRLKSMIMLFFTLQMPATRLPISNGNENAKKRKVESLFLEYYWRSIRDRHSFSSHDCNYCPNQDWRTKKLQKKVKCKKHEIVWLIFHKKAEVQIGSYFLYLSKHGIDMHINQVIFRKILSILRYRLF